jgi:hypothetical protein
MTRKKKKAQPIPFDELLSHIRQCRGAELPKWAWEVAETLVDRGFIRLSDAHGPGKKFKRAELADE